MYFGGQSLIYGIISLNYLQNIKLATLILRIYVMTAKLRGGRFEGGFKLQRSLVPERGGGRFDRVRFDI